jgi:hypothetical protein
MGDKLPVINLGTNLTAIQVIAGDISNALRSLR